MTNEIDEELVERVSSAIAQAKGMTPVYHTEGYAALSSLKSGDVIGGLMVVPVEPTEKMLHANLSDSGYTCSDYLDNYSADEVYKAMLEACKEGE